MTPKLKIFTLRKITTGGKLIIQFPSLTALRKRFPAGQWELIEPEPESGANSIGNHNEATGN